MSRAYPTHREADVALRDGSTVRVRPIRPADEGRLAELLRSLSVDARALRFFSAGVDVDAAARRDSQVDYEHVFGLVATIGADERIVGHAMYASRDGERAEIAFTVAEDFRGHGLGTILLGQLAEAAAQNGIQTFTAEVLPANHRMLGVFRSSGFPITVHAVPGEIRVSFPTSLTAGAIERFEQREHVAAVSALRRFLAPRSVAVIGASRQRGTVGGELFHNLLTNGFAGPVYPVNPAAPVVHSVLAYPAVEAIPGPVDLALIAVPAADVLDVARQCARKHVGALVVISAGFAEVGAAGRQLERDLVRLCRDAGMRLIGPNCIGIINTDPAVSLDATFGPTFPPAGSVGFASQSGALGLAAIEATRARGIGISTFVSTGNKADISGNDLLQYWESDPRTDVIMLYLESFGNPRKFGRIARRVGRRKPILVVKSGRSAAGVRATSSHTGALVAASDVSVDALCRQAGVIRADTIDGMFDVANLLARQPVPTGRRVGIVTNVGGPAILCADACEAEGLVVPALAEATRAGLTAMLPAEASVFNPVDMLASATAAQYREAVRLVAADPAIDAVVAIFIQPLATRADEVARAVSDAATEVEGGKPVLMVIMTAAADVASERLVVPVFDSPERAVMALARSARYGAWRQQPWQPAERPTEIRRDEAAGLVAAALGRGGGWLAPAETAALLGCYGLPLVDQRIVESADEAGAAAEALGGTVALKGIAPGLIHKSDAGAIRLDLAGDDAVAAAHEMAERLTALGHPPTGFLVQPMLAGGLELILGLVHDPSFGPVLACGAGGITAELLRDVAVRLAPLAAHDPSSMLQELRTYPLLTGYRGAPTRDVGAVEDAIRRISTLAEDLPQVAELDCNPLLVFEQGARIVDARARVEAVDPPPPLGARRA